MTRRLAQWLTIIFFVGLVALVFQQINTSMKEQGIASGGPYDNAAAFPKAVSFCIIILLSFQILIELFKLRYSHKETPIPLSEFKRPFGMLFGFAIYLLLLNPLGYHLTTAPMVYFIIVLCGYRNYVVSFFISISIALILAFIFENFLRVVLPGGIFAVHIPWII